MHRQLAFAFLVLASLLLDARVAYAQVPVPANAPQVDVAKSAEMDSGNEPFTPSPEFQTWIAGLVREQLPDHYEKRKNWGHTSRALAGVSIKLADGKLKTRRTYKQANDGSWQMYRVDLVEPEDKFDIRVENLRELDDGRVGLRITAVASLNATGRQALWEKGVQIYSISAEADARVRLTADAAIAMQLDPTRFPPDVYLRPEVNAAKVEILQFKLRRISDLHGPLIRSLSHTVRKELEDKLAEDNAKLVAKLNKSIDKHEDKLKLSAADLVRLKWDRFSGASAPAAAESRPAGE